MTYLARDSLDRRVVIKECFPASMCSRANNIVRARSVSHQKEFGRIVQRFVLEARRLAKLKHPNIVGVHQVFEDNNTAYMALDYVDGLDLLDLLDDGKKQFGPEETRHILITILGAIEFIHSRNILHRDISPDNILIDRRGNPILIDFGAAREKATKASRVLSAVLTVKDGYSPQEFYIAGTPQGPASDIYALAATFYHVMTGEAPPNSQTRLAAIAAKREDPYRTIAVRVKNFDPSFLNAIDKALSIFPKDRLQSATEWMEEIDVEKRRAKALADALHDEKINLAISQLVSETNLEVGQQRGRADSSSLVSDTSADKSRPGCSTQSNDTTETKVGGRKLDGARRWCSALRSSRKGRQTRSWLFGKSRSEQCGKANS
jgi:serine/threonine protein kinase